MDPRNIIRNPATQSALHDYTKAKEKADADRRRAKLDSMRAKVGELKNQPVLGESAKLGTRSLGGLHSHAVVVVKYVHKDKSTRSYAICELSLNGDQGLVLILPCPSCLFRHGRSVSESHLTHRSWHRGFSLDTTNQGVTWVNPQNPSEIVTLAGAVETHEVQTCPVCNFKFELERLRSSDPSEVGISVLREV